MKKVFLLGILLLCVGFVLSGTPTTPSTISPINNSIYWNNNTPTLYCSGATDPNDKPLNVTFLGSGSGIEDLTAGNVQSTSGYTPCQESGSGDGYRYSTNNITTRADSDGYGAYGWESLVYGDELTINFDIRRYIQKVQICVNGTQVFQDNTFDCMETYCHTPDCCQTPTLDLSAFTGKKVNISIRGQAAGGGYSAWAHFNWSGGASQGVLQNSSSTTYEWDDFSFPGSVEWSCKACNWQNCSISSSNITLIGGTFTSCSPSDTGLALNLSVWDEEDNSLNLTSDIDLFMTMTSPQDSRTYSFASTSENNHYWCINPDTISGLGTGYADYVPVNGAGDYTYQRQYYFNDINLSDSSIEEVKMYSLIDALSTAVTFTVSRAGAAVSDILIHLQRFDAGTGAFKLSAMGKTGSFGTDIIYLRLTDAFYRVLAYETDQLVYSSGTQHITSTAFPIILSGGPGGVESSDWFSEWESLDTITFSLNYTNSTQFFHLIADDSSGVSTSMCLKVDQYDMLNGTTNICYQCVSSSSVSISCAISNTDAYYVGQFVAYRDDFWRVLGSVTADLKGKIADTIGLDAAFYAFILVGVSAFAAIWSPASAIILSLLGMSTMIGLGFLDIAWSFNILMIVAGIILIVAMYKRRKM